MREFYKTNCATGFSKKVKTFAVLIIATLLSVTVVAQNYTVTNTTDGLATNQLRGAIVAADAIGGTHIITVNPGTYTLTLGEITFGNNPENITINGAGAATTIISMTGNVAQRDRIFFINPVGTTNSPVISVSGLTFQNGYLTSDIYGGAGICAGGGSGESLTVTNCIFTNNIVPANDYGGGAICMQVRGDLTVDNCTFTNNVSNDADGGAIFFITYNSGVGTGFGVMNVTNSTFTGNSVVFPGAGTSNGGAIGFSGQAGVSTCNATITNNTFINNTADGLGGAIVVNNSPNLSIPQIHFNRFVGNTGAASAASGAFHFVESSGSVNADNNWWGCNTGPAAGPCDRAGGDIAGGGTLTLTKWLQLKTTASPATICNTAPSTPTNTSTITTSFLSNSASEVIPVSNLSALIGLPVTWGPTTLGNLSAQQGTIQASGTATATFTSNGTAGTATVNAQVDNVPAAEVSPARASITVNAASVAPTGATGITTVCNGGSTTLTVTGGSKGTAAVTQWFTGSCGGTLVFTGDALNTGALVATTTYFVRYNGTCNTTTCATVTVNVNDVTGGTMGSDQTICSGGDPAAFTETVAATGSGALTYQWQSSTTSCAAGFSNIGGATSATYDAPSGLAITTYYRRVTTSTLSGVPCTANSNCITVTVNNVTGGTVGSDQTVSFGGDPAAFTQSVASTGGGALTYQWQSSTTSCAAGFSDIAGATSITYDPPAGITQTTYYHRVTTSTLNALPCTATSNCITVTVCPAITVTNPVITSGFANAPFSQTFTASGGTAPYTFTTVSPLPTGLTLSTAGVLSGTPTATGTFNITVTATATGGCTGTGANYPLVISANACGSGSQVAQLGAASSVYQANAINGFTIPAGTNRLLVVTVSDPGAIVIGSVNFGASPMTYQAHKSDGFFAVDGIFTLPLGSSGSSSSGNITVAGAANKFMTATVFQFVNQVTPVSGQDSIQLTPNPPSPNNLTINSAANDLTFDIFDFFTTPSAANTATFGTQTPIINQGPLTLPFGFAYYSTSMKNGSAPNVVMTRAVPGPTVQEALIHVALNIKAGATIITVTNPVVTTGAISTPFSQTFTASGGSGPYVFTTFSALPAGLTLSSAGVLSGTPTVTGTFPIVVSATDANGCFGNGAVYNLVISACTPSSITLGASPTVCKGTTTASLPYTATTGSPDTYSIDYDATANAAGFVDVVNAALPVSPITLTVPGAAAGGTYNATITVIKTVGGCISPAVSFTVSVNDVTGGTVAADQTVCSGGDPALFTQTVASTGTGALTYQWQSNTTSCVAAFANIGGATAATYDAPAGLLVTTYYRRITTSTLNAVACSANSNCITVTVNNVTGGTVAADQTICSGGDPAAFTQTVASTGSGALTYQWQSNTTSCVAAFTNIAGATGTTYDAPFGLTQTTYYRRVTTSTLNAVACTANSNCVTVTVNDVTGGTVAADQTICSGGDPAAFTQTVASTGSGALTYQWQSNTTSCVAAFSNIGGATAATYDAPSGLTQTTYYRRVTTSTLNAVACTANSNCITVTVNDVTGGTVAADQTICSGGDPALFTQTVASTGSGALTYQWQSNTTSCVAAFSNIAGATAATYDAPSGLTQTTYYRRVTTSTLNAVACTANSNCITVTVNDVTGGTVAADQTICSGGDPALFTQTVASTGSGALTYQWQSNTTSCVAAFSNIGGATAATYDAPSGLTQTTYYRRVTTSTLNAVACTANSNCITVTVNNVTGGTVAADQTICSGGDPAAFTQTVASTGSGALTYQWQSNTTSCVVAFSNIGGATAATYDAPLGLTQTTYYRRVTTSTLNAVACTANSNCVTVTVNPIPDAIATPASQAICSGSAITTIALTGSVPGTVFNWTRDNTVSVTGIGASGSGNISGALTNTTNAPVTVTFTITPTANGCPGAPITATVLVNPTPNAVATPASQTICSANPITTIVLTGNVAGTTFIWTRDNTGTITGIAASGSGNISGTLTNTTYTPITVTFTIIPTANGCPGAPVTATILVNPTPNAVAAPSSQTICSVDAIAPIVLSGNVSGTTFNWTRDNTGTVTGIAASGSGNISGTLTNTTNAPVTVTFTITPTANGCPGSPINATVLVNPTPHAVATPASQTICSGTAITTIVLTGAVSGTTFNWTRNNTVTVTGIADNGNGDIIGSLTNTTNAPVTVTFIISPTANGCTGPSITATVLVNPIPNATATPVSQTICSAGTITTIVLTGAVSGTTFNWTRNNTVTVTGIAASGSGNISGALTNTTNAPVTVTFTITPTANGCTGSSITANVLVNPTPNAVATPSSQTICSGTAISTIVLTGAVSGTTFNWTRDNTGNVTGIAVSGSGNISGSLTNITTAQQTVTFTITPTANGCPGAPITATVIVQAPLTIICPANIVVNATAGTCGADVTYPSATITGTPAPTVTYSIPSGSNFPVGVTTVIVISSNICGTVTCSFTITVNDVRVPVVTTQPVNSTVCVGASATFSVVSINTASFQWQQLSGAVWNDIPGATGTSYLINTTTPGMNNNIYRVRLTGPCGTVVYSNQVTLVVNPLPLITLSSATTPELRPGRTVTINATGLPGGGSFAWLFNGGPITGVTTSSYGPLSVDNIGRYNVIYTDPNGCISTSADFLVTGESSDLIFIYPNPNSGRFQIRFNNESGEVARIAVFDPLGQMIRSIQVTTGPTTYSRIDIDLGNMTGGVYTVKLIGKNEVVLGAKRVLIAR